MGVTLLSEIYAADDVAAGRMKLVPLAGQKLSREIGLAVRKNDYQSQSVKALIGVAKKVKLVKR
jgi:DNA-binding transcriptional LysR family regulator